MIREKFEEWFNKRFLVSNEQGSHIKEMCYVAWSAGRVSMREEAAKQWDECMYDIVGGEVDIGESIRKIEP